jgi:hypothetical protein
LEVATTKEPRPLERYVVSGTKVRLGESDGKATLALAPHARKEEESGEMAASAARGSSVARRRMKRTAIEVVVVVEWCRAAVAGRGACMRVVEDDRGDKCEAVVDMEGAEREWCVDSGRGKVDLDLES